MSEDAQDALRKLTGGPTTELREPAHKLSVAPYSVANIAARIQEGEQTTFAADEEYHHLFAFT